MLMKFLNFTKGGKWSCIMQGHYDGEVWGCAASPKEHKFVSCGGDKTVRLWDGYVIKIFGEKIKTMRKNSKMNYFLIKANLQI